MGAGIFLVRVSVPGDRVATPTLIFESPALEAQLAAFKAPPAPDVADQAFFFASGDGTGAFIVAGQGAVRVEPQNLVAPKETDCRIAPNFAARQEGARRRGSFGASGHRACHNEAEDEHAYGVVSCKADGAPAIRRRNNGQLSQ